MKLNMKKKKKKLINQVKKIVDISEYSMEEIQQIFEELNQAIVSNRKEETIVKVESSLSDMKTCSCSNEISDEKIREKLVMSNLNSPSMSILRQPKSPVYRAFRIQTNEPEESTMAKDNDHSIQVDNGLNNIMSDDQTFDPFKDEADDEQHNQENVINRKDLPRCPLTFDGAFGLTKEKHFIEFCLKDNGRKQNMWSHFKQKHKLKLIYIQRLLQAIRNGQDPKTTKLFSENEVVIEPDRRYLCPFSSNMIHLIGCCPPQSRNIPCQAGTLLDVSLALHLARYHHVSYGTAKKIRKNYKEKLSKMISSNGNGATSY